MTETDGRWRHASGDDYEGCVACWIDQDEEGLTAPNIRPCTTPEDDPDEPGVCRWCSHTAEPVPAQDSLLCPDCENASCRCAA